MQERQVSIAGQTRDLPSPFHVLATQNPIEQEGTYPLPEAQLDRFLLRIDVDFPDRETERKILAETTGVGEKSVKSIFAPNDLLDAQAIVRSMPVGKAVVDAILDIVRSARPEEDDAPDIVKDAVNWGPGPRASQAFMLAIRAQALAQGRLAPSVDDVVSLAEPVLRHRMGLSFGARAQGTSHTQVIAALTERFAKAKSAA